MSTVLICVCFVFVGGGISLLATLPLYAVCRCSVVQSKPVSSSPSQSVVDQVMGTFSSLNPQEQHQTIVVL